MKDADNHTTQFNYDAADQKLSMAYPDDPNPNAPTTDYEAWGYDNAFNLKSRRTVNGTTQNFTFDNRNRKTGMSWSNGADSATYRYDAASRLSDANNPSATIHRVYDSAGRLTNDTQTPVGLAAKDLQYTYDNANRLIRTMMPGTGDNYTRSYDARGRLATVGDSNGGAWVGYGYDASSSVTSRNTLLTGSYELFPRDALNRITSRGLVQNGAAVSTETYTYDDASHVSRLTGVARSEDGKSDKFGYDYASELVSAQYGLVSGTNPNRTVGYTLDLVGNRNIVTDGGVNSNYAPNALNQYTGSVGPAAITNGNEHEIASYLGVAYQYINDGQLKQATSGANVYGIKYDALGRVVSRTLNNATTYYINDGEQAFNEWSATGSWLATNIYGAGVDEIVMRFTPTIVYTFYQDHEGSITHVYGGLTLAETYRYDAFGQPKILSATGSQLTTSAINNRFMFTGREWAPVNLGFYEYRARAYHPGLGRFMSQDPLGFQVQGAKLAPEQTALYPIGKAPEKFGSTEFNLFRYCANDPEDKIDPWGLDPVDVSPEANGLALEGDSRNLAHMQASAHIFGLLAYEFSTTVFQNSQGNLHLSKTRTDHHPRDVRPQENSKMTSLVETHNHTFFSTDPTTHSTLSRPDVQRGNQTGRTQEVVSENEGHTGVVRDRYRPSANAAERQSGQGGTIERLNGQGQWQRLQGANTNLKNPAAYQNWRQAGQGD